jgi:alpha-glucosidase
MKFIKITFMIACLLNMPRVMAQSPVTAAGNLETVTIGKQDIEFKTSNAYGKISVYSPSIIRVRLDRKPIESNFSYAVVGEPQQTKTTITQTNETITLVTDSVKAIIQKQPFSIAFYTPEGALINEDEQGLTHIVGGYISHNI